MKKEYIAPEVEISVFDTEDIMALSNGGNLGTGEEYGNLFG